MAHTQLPMFSRRQTRALTVSVPARGESSVKFQFGDPVIVSIPSRSGEPIDIPGICVSDEYPGEYTSRATGQKRPNVQIDVVTYHEVPAELASDGVAKTFFKRQPQSTNFMTLRTSECQLLDAKSLDELEAAVVASTRELQMRTRPVASGPVKTALQRPAAAVTAITREEASAPATTAA